jgi:hypothetical protein
MPEFSAGPTLRLILPHARAPPCAAGVDTTSNVELRHGAVVYGFGRLWLQPG